MQSLPIQITSPALWGQLLMPENRKGDDSELYGVYKSGTFPLQVMDSADTKALLPGSDIIALSSQQGIILCNNITVQSFSVL